MVKNKKLEQLERELDKRAPLPILILSYGMTDDNLYHGQGDTVYSQAEIEALEATGECQIILLSYVDDWRADA